ncbi:hypothetical protein MVI27_10100 [Chryseobacterium salipaludis]|uniref:hypothetical protein n=1 Tax=Chryseobacterium TaxID=59732 RepID=UPI001FF3D084|nr:MULTISPECIES: hypothetical protein [Chryseobacterium]MCJ8498611.1 hypothetical protein [Chryseobacterium salipaludis]MCX3297739.1 hypothetical protein [Planobacterium sp. JC490]
MSGSGGGSYVAPQRNKFDCDKTTLTTTVSSIDIMVLKKHQVRDVLEVMLSSSETLILEDRNGEILGTILHLNTVDIIECIKNGTSYTAEIKSINSPACIVYIQKKQND